MMLIKSSFPQKAKTKIEKKIGLISTEITDKHNIKKIDASVETFYQNGAPRIIKTRNRNANSIRKEPFYFLNNFFFGILQNIVPCIRKCLAYSFREKF